MTTAKGFGPKTSDLTTADNRAITVKAETVAPIAADASAKWELFTARPSVAATGSAFKTAGNGFKTIWTEEQENEYGKSFLMWGFSIFKAIALPLLSLIWLAINTAYVWTRKPETKAAIIARYQSLKTWLAPKFSYEREPVDEAAIEL